MGSRASTVTALLLLSAVLPFRALAHDPQPRTGAVFTQSNEADHNAVLAFARDASGALGEPLEFATGGVGSGDSLGSQGALALTDDRRFLLVVNAGSNDVSSFAVRGAALTLVDRVETRGTRPISVAEQDGKVFVLNAGDVANVAGFWLDRAGHLHALPGKPQPVLASSGPAQVEISADGRRVIVSEKAANDLLVFHIDLLGRLSPPTVQPSAGRTPFGFAVADDGLLVVSEAASGSASSYQLTSRSRLLPISSAVSDTQLAPCWVALSRDQRFAFVANAGSSSISSYAIDRFGQLTLRAAVAGDTGAMSRPLDLASSRDGRHLYVVDRGNRGVLQLAVERDGMLDARELSGELSSFATGLAAY